MRMTKFSRNSPHRHWVVTILGHPGLMSSDGLAQMARLPDDTVMATEFDSGLEAVKERLLVMASHAEAAVNRAVKALIRRDDDLARRTKEDDSVIDQL